MNKNYICCCSKCPKCLYLLYAVIHISLIILGVYFQITTCFSRQNPYAHWVHAYNFNESQNNITNSTIQYCRLKCDIDKNFVTGLLIPDIIIVLLSFWIHFGDYFSCLFCKCKKLSKECSQQKDGAQQSNDAKECCVDELVLECKPLNKCSTLTYTICAIVYVALSLSISGFDLIIFKTFIEKDVVIQSPITTSNGNFKVSKIVASFFGFFAFDLLYIQVIMRYAYQCSMLTNHLKLNKNTYNTEETTKENTPADKPEGIIEDACKRLRCLNKKSAATGIVILIAGFTAISCVMNLLNTTDCSVNVKTSSPISIKQSLQVAAVICRLLLWSFIVLFPFYKAAKVNKASRKLGFRLVMHSSNTAKISKGVKYITSEARLIGIPVQPWLPYVVVLLLLFAIMLGSSTVWYFHLL